MVDPGVVTVGMMLMVVPDPAAQLLTINNTTALFAAHPSGITINGSSNDDNNV